MRKELSTCKAKKDVLVGNLIMVHTELESAKATIKRMNAGSMKLDKILKSKRNDSSKTGICYIHGASTSKDKDKSIFV